MARPGFLLSRLTARWRQVGRLTYLAVAAGLIVALAVVAGLLDVRRRGEADLIGYATAIDGDSLRIESDEVRLAGIDAPEYAQTCQDGAGRDYPCGRLARRALARMLVGGPARCVISGRDAYNRRLGHCFQGETDLNATLVREGHAVAFGGYDSEEAQARAARRGLWSGAFIRPVDYRQRHPGAVPDRR